MRNLTLLTDFYELTMMYGYFLQGKTEEVATFDLFFRPYDESNFCIAAGLEQAIEYVENLRFSDEDIEYLRGTKAFNEAFLAFLADFRFTGSIRAVPEGTVVFPYEPLMIITAPICQAQYYQLSNAYRYQGAQDNSRCRQCGRVRVRLTPRSSPRRVHLRRKSGGNRRMYVHKQRIVLSNVRHAS